MDHVFHIEFCRPGGFTWFKVSWSCAAAFPNIYFIDLISIPVFSAINFRVADEKIIELCWEVKKNENPFGLTQYHVEDIFNYVENTLLQSFFNYQHIYVVVYCIFHH